MVERFNFHAKRRIDLFGIIDIVAINLGQIVGVQSTSYAQRKSHLNKIYGDELENTKAWLAAGCHLWLISWKKQKIKPGGVAFRYEPIVDIIQVAGPKIVDKTLKFLLPLK